MSSTKSSITIYIDMVNPASSIPHAIMGLLTSFPETKSIQYKDNNYSINYTKEINCELSCDTSTIKPPNTISDRLPDTNNSISTTTSTLTSTPTSTSTRDNMVYDPMIINNRTLPPQIRTYSPNNQITFHDLNEFGLSNKLNSHSQDKIKSWEDFVIEYTAVNSNY